MPIKVGDRLPEGTLIEMIDVETPGCTLGPNSFRVSELAKGKRIVLVGLPGAFTPT
jgi:peroxiredoxin